MSGLVDKITKAVMGISAIVVFVITFLQVLCRFVLKSPLPWSTDILRLAFTYLVFWGAAWCVREKEHLNVDVLLMSFPVKIRKVVELGIDLVLSLFFIFMIVFGIKFCAFGWTQTTSYLPIPMSVYYASIPSAGAIMLFYMIKNMRERYDLYCLIICLVFNRNSDLLFTRNGIGGWNYPGRNPVNCCYPENVHRC